LDSISWSCLEDVRGLDRERHGEFDVVLCLGLLYHLDAPDVFMLLERIRDVCRFMTVIETHIAPYPKVRRERRRQSYWGVVGTEPSIETPPLSREALWSSLGNAQSFKLTRSSLCNALADAGYSSVVECHVPTWVRADRATFVAFTRSQQRILSVSELHRMPDRLRERRVPLIEVLRRQPVYALVRKLVPTPLKRYVRRLRPRLTRPRWHEE
jgi:hypothetical protein